MNKLTWFIVIMAFPLAVAALITDPDTHPSGLRCIAASPGEVSLELNLSGISADHASGIVFPRELQPYLISGDPSPGLAVNLAIPFAGEYEVLTDIHWRQTDLTAPQNLGPSADPVVLSREFRIREVRGVRVLIHPLRSVNGKLQVLDRLGLELRARSDPYPASSGPAFDKINPYFTDIYRNTFINWDPRYEDLAEYGSLAVICPPCFSGLIQPWVEWKNQKGIPATIYSTNQTGDTYESIKAFIRNLYQSDPNLTFVQLVGDYAQLPCLVEGLGSQYGGRDADYTLMDDNDYYPDLFVGRFSAETQAELYTQVQRSLDYEKDIVSGAWLSRAIGCCSVNPPIPGDDGEMGWDHLDKLRAQLLDFTYTEVDRVYANEGAGTQDLIDSLNEGASLFIFNGEGYYDYWITPYFNVDHALALTNTGMLPFMQVSSCSTGQFIEDVCLAEALMRSRDPSSEQARGAIAVYAAAPHQGVAPPMEAQDHMVDLLVSGTKNTIGGLCYNGSCNMIDQYGEYGGYANFYGWNLFGDCSLQLRTKAPDLIEISIPNLISPGSTSLALQTGAADILAGLSLGGSLLASAFSDSLGVLVLNWQQPLPAGESLLLTVTGFNRKTMQRQILCLDPGGLELATAISDDQPFLEAEQLVSVTVNVMNNSQITANGIVVSLVSLSDHLLPVIPDQAIAQLAPGAEAEVTLSYRVSRSAPDLSLVSYRIVVTAGGQTLSHSFRRTLHAPVLRITGVERQPLRNWVKAGELVTLGCGFGNMGSGPLRDLAANLSASYGEDHLAGGSGSLALLPAGSADSLSFSLQIPSDSQPGTMWEVKLSLSSANAPDSVLTYFWRVIDPDSVQESFESADLEEFPWIRTSGQWTISEDAFEGSHSLCSTPSSADSLVLRLDFTSLQPGFLTLFHKVLYLGPGESWNLFLNGSLYGHLDPFPAWQGMELPLDAGSNSIRFVGTRDPAAAAFSGLLVLDAIGFPARTVFDNARLAVDNSPINLILGPGEITGIPLDLRSADGKYLCYSALIMNAAKPGLDPQDPCLTCNKQTFAPGTSENLILTLHGTNVTGLRITLPDGVLATSASDFSLPGQAGLAFTGRLGSFSPLEWQNPQGTTADSLRAVLRISSDAGLPELGLFYRIEFLSGFFSGFLGLAGSGQQQEFLGLSPWQGELLNGQVSTIQLKANQNLLAESQASYELRIYYNGNNTISIPLTVIYDPEPEGFHDALHLTVYPNPVKDEAMIAYSVPADGPADLSLYNLRGQKIGRLVHADLAKGYYSCSWAASREDGSPLPNGVYFCRLEAGGRKAKVVRFTLIR
jgi:hypothetical protein